MREGVQWLSWGGRDPLHEYLTSVDAMFQELEARIDEEIPKRLAEAEAGGRGPTERGATWTYLTTDQPFGAATERILRGIVRKVRAGRVWGVSPQCNMIRSRHADEGARAGPTAREARLEGDALERQSTEHFKHPARHI